MEYILYTILISVIVFVLTHLHPLTEPEVNQLAKKRRTRLIRSYFAFDRREYTPDNTFKKNMNKNGAFYNINEPLYRFPAVAAALLKWKKHEWIIVAFEKDNKIDLIWVNKGFDDSRVALYLPLENIIEISRQNGYQSILEFHNHPNSNPRYYDCTKPSELDIKTSIEFSRKLNDNGINFVNFVCERGKHYEFWLSTAKGFFPLEDLILEISRNSGLSWGNNLRLHFERIC